MHIHVDPISGPADVDPSVVERVEQRALVDRAINLLESDEKVEDEPGTEPLSIEQALETARSVTSLFEEEQDLQEEASRLARELTALEPWGEFEPVHLSELEEKRVHVRLLQMTGDELRNIPDDLAVFSLEEGRGQVRGAAVFLGDEAPALPGVVFQTPERGIAEVRVAMAETRTRIESLRERRSAFGAHLGALRLARAKLDGHVQFEQIRTGMSTEGPLSYLTGYVPADHVEGIERAGSSEGWALLIEEPNEEDPVPTLVRNPAWIRIIKPVFDFLGTVPGYSEYDISFWFLLFFSIFWAMIIGDAGYGLVFLGLTIFARAKAPKAPPEPFGLLAVTSVFTIVWGALSGTWFGSRVLAQWAPFSNITIDAIASFPRGGVDVASNIMAICFLIGAVHITIAHLVAFVRKFPRAVAFSELGWLGVLWGMYFVIQVIVMKKPMDTLVAPAIAALTPALAPLGSVTFADAALWLVLAGLGFVVVFAEQGGNFFKGLLLGIANLPLKLLDSISAFSDVVSYVRLFAVGLATVKVAEAFNTMAAGVGFGIPSGLGAALILFFGHGLNIVMGALSLVVHGVRLNVLEFSGHLNIEWKGVPYRPFRELETE
jgi:V/A-type H+-transporting ATPase subunit I